MKMDAELLVEGVVVQMESVRVAALSEQCPVDLMQLATEPATA